MSVFGFWGLAVLHLYHYFDINAQAIFRINEMERQSQGHCATVSQSVSLSWYQAPPKVPDQRRRNTIYRSHNGCKGGACGVVCEGCRAGAIHWERTMTCCISHSRSKGKYSYGPFQLDKTMLLISHPYFPLQGLSIGLHSPAPFTLKMVTALYTKTLAFQCKTWLFKSWNYMNIFHSKCVKQNIQEAMNILT